MKRTASILVLVALSASPAVAGGAFYGGAADGAAAAQEMELQRRALDLDRRYGTDHYYQLRQQQDLQAIRRELEQQRREREWQRTLDPLRQLFGR